MKKRILVLLSVVALMVVMLAMAVAPVFAQGRSENAPNCEHGNNTAYDSAGFDNRNPQATESLDKNSSGPSHGKEQGAYCLQP